MTDVGVATRVHMREERTLSKYRVARGRYLFMRTRPQAAPYPWSRLTSERQRDRSLVADAMYWRSRWSTLREIIDAEEQRAKVAA